MEREVKLKTEEEKKAALEATLARIRPIVKANVEKDSSVMGRLSKYATADTEEKQDKTKAKDNKSYNLGELTEKKNKLDKKAKEHGLEPISKKNKKDEKEDDKENNKKKENEKKNEDPIAKKEKEMKEKYSRVSLPSGMEIHQEGPSWVLVSKDGKHRTDITEVMGAIDKFNRNVDEANVQNRMQNEAQSGVDKAVDVNKKEQINDRNSKIQTVTEALPNVKDIEGKQVFKPEDLKKVAETSIDFSNDTAMLEAMKKEAKKLENEAKDKDKKNNNKSDKENRGNSQTFQQQMQQSLDR